MVSASGTTGTSRAAGALGAVSSGGAGSDAGGGKSGGGGHGGGWNQERQGHDGQAAHRAEPAHPCRPLGHGADRRNARAEDDGHDRPLECIRRRHADARDGRYARDHRRAREALEPRGRGQHRDRDRSRGDARVGTLAVRLQFMLPLTVPVPRTGPALWQT